MAALNRTNLVLVAAPLPPDFEGDLQDFYEALVERLQILSPVGTNFFVVGDVEPSSNQGPWLRNGNQWWVFSETLGRYVPIDISASTQPDFFVGPNDPGTPTATDPIFWIRTQDNHVVGLYGWTGSEWRASANVDSSGTTAQRPGSPADLEHFWDTTISGEIIFERGAWRTVSGSVGDIKYVAHATLALALQYNPGWDLFGRNDQTVRGKALAGAAKDPGATPTDSFTTDSGITPRAAGDQAGEEVHVLLSAEQEPHCHSMGRYSTADPNGLTFHREENADVLATPAPVPPNGVALSGDGRVPIAGVVGPGGAGEGIITSGQFLKTIAPAYCGTATGHNTIQPTVFQWCLVKL